MSGYVHTIDPPMASLAICAGRSVSPRYTARGTYALARSVSQWYTAPTERDYAHNVAWKSG